MSVCEPVAALAAGSDDDVMACVQDGSMVAFGVLYDRYYDRAYRVAWSVCRDAGRAEEAVQEAFISIWKTRMTYLAQAGKVAAWVLTVVRYRAIDTARRTPCQRRHPPHRPRARQRFARSRAPQVRHPCRHRRWRRHDCARLVASRRGEVGSPPALYGKVGGDPQAS